MPCLVGALALTWFMPAPRNNPYLWLMIVLVPFLFVAVLLATRGFRETTILRVALSIYAVFLVPTGLFMCGTDVVDNMNEHWKNSQWSNTNFWLGFGLELSFILSPVVFGFAALFTYFYNQLYWQSRNS